MRAASRKQTAEGAGRARTSRDATPNRPCGFYLDSWGGGCMARGKGKVQYRKFRHKGEIAMRACNADGSMLPAIGSSLRRRSSTNFVAAVALAIAILAIHPAAIAADERQDGDRGRH